MRILHATARSRPEDVDGASNSVWVLAREQARLGHEVTVLAHQPVDADARRGARAAGVRLLPWWQAAALRRSVDVLHAHSAFAPKAAAVQAVLAGRVRVVASPRGALADAVLTRHRLKKAAYLAAVERPRLSGVDLFAVLTAAEGAEVRDVIGGRGTPVRVCGNPVPVRSPRGSGPREGVVFLGRFDGRHKGLDRLLAAARVGASPIALHGSAPADEATRRMLADAPATVSVRAPVFGDAKAAVLASAALYVQPSRWEAFGRSIVEAAMLGTPVVLSAECALGPEVERAGAGVVVDFDRPELVAGVVDDLLSPSSAGRRAAMGERAAAWARENYAADAVARRTLDAYAEALARSERATA